MQRVIEKQVRRLSRGNLASGGGQELSSMVIAANRLKQIIGLESEPVAVYLVPSSAGVPAALESFDRAPGHRYCQLLMRARAGESLRQTAEDIACPAAASAFGFKPLTEGLASGKGLVGFGIVSEATTGRTMFATMPHLAPGAIATIAACPLTTSPSVPDVVVVEGPPEQLMWLLLADLNLAGGVRRLGNTAVLQATCVDATVIPLLERRMNFSLGCYGCREATDMGANETVLGFPGAALTGLVAALEQLDAKAIARSRGKMALNHLKEKQRQA